MKRTLTTIAATLALAAFTTAQTPPPGTAQERRENQQDRVGQGIASGQLTAAETAKIEAKEAAINREIRRDKAANGGKLTPQQRRQVNRQQNALSQQIYNEKHDGQTQHYGTNEVDARRKAQQQRIGQGVANGSISAGEAAKLETREAAINRQVHNERAANGGTLTPAQKRQVNREQNKASKKIYTDKHN